MARRFLVILLLVGLVPVAVATAGSSSGKLLSASKQRYTQTEDIVITLTNTTARKLRFDNPWKLKRGDEMVAEVRFRDRTLRPDESKTWTLPQPPCGDEPPCSGPTWLEAARYRVVVRTSEGRLSDTFDTGEYFTLGFRHDDVEFTLYARVQEAIDQMRAEVAKPEDERNLITSGIVRKGRPYNPAWSYTMGPGTIALGEVFMEVCDANPHYVEENRDAWLGDRWCPWDSYVKRIGR